MSAHRDEALDELVATMKRAAAALDDAGIPAALAGGMAAWARGGPPTDHDVDFFVREQDIEGAGQALAAAGMRPERAPEGWLLKAWDGDVLVDLIFHPSGKRVDDAMLARAERMELKAIPLLVASIDDVLATKLLALTEQEPDFGAVLAIGRALREQIDWERVRRETECSPFARAYFTLAEGLEIAPRLATSSPGVPPARPLRPVAERVRVSLPASAGSGEERHAAL